MLLHSVLNRFSADGRPINLDSREYGYLILQLEYIEENNITIPIKIKFIPDSHLSVNQLMEFKQLHTDMRLILSRLSESRPEEGLKIIYKNKRIYITISNKYSDMELQLPEDSQEHIKQLLDQLSIVISTNTFFELDLKEIKNTGKKHYQEWRNYFLSYYK